jgi:SH3-like domain-containing protein
MSNSRNRLMAGILVVLLVLAVSSTGLVAGDTFFVQSKNVEVKAGRGDLQPTIYKPKLGEAFEILEQKDSWYKVRTPKGDGWVSEDSVSLKKPEAD